jgi:hypothetical protein
MRGGRARSDPAIHLSRSICEHIIGVSVSETSAENSTAAASEMPNSPNSRPMLPWMKEIGHEHGDEHERRRDHAKPISRAPSMEAMSGCSRKASTAPVDVLEHDDRVVHDEPDREHEPEQREHVDRVAHERPSRRRSR